MLDSIVDRHGDGLRLVHITQIVLLSGPLSHVMASAARYQSVEAIV